MTEPIREAIYGVVAALMTLLTVLNVFDSNTASQVGAAITSLIGAATALLAYANTNKRGKHEE